MNNSHRKSQTLSKKKSKRQALFPELNGLSAKIWTFFNNADEPVKNVANCGLGSILGSSNAG